MFTNATVYSHTSGSDTVCLVSDTLAIEWNYRGADVTSYIVSYAVKEKGETSFGSWITLTSQTGRYLTTPIPDGGGSIIPLPGVVYKFRIQAVYSGEIFDSVETNEIKIGGVSNVYTDGQWKQGYTWVYTNGAWKMARLIQVYHNGSWNNYS